MTVERLVFDVAAGVAILFGGLMVVARNPVRGVLTLVVSFFALAATYVMLLSPFIAAIQVIVYAGAILVLFLFVLMLLNLGHISLERSRRPLQTFLGSIAIILFAALLLGTLRSSGAKIPVFPDAIPPAAMTDPAGLSRNLFSDYLLHFEAVSVLLLAALVGAFVLARREKRS
jgi:NADH-quinone oxidoreductase subunit J